jgi:hypothetical protein
MQKKTSPNTNIRSERVSARVHELLGDRHGMLPVWVRAPKAGPEYFSGLSRSKLYELHAQDKIDSRSIRRPGQVKGTRLFSLCSILDFIENCEREVSSDESST